MSTFSNECRKAALDGILALLSGGSLRLDTSADAEIAVLPISAVGAGTTASPSVAVLSLTADTSITNDVAIAKFILRTSGGATRINGTVSATSGDLVITDVDVPDTATEIGMPGGLSVSLQIS
jgi:hypothetical protein